MHRLKSDHRPIFLTTTVESDTSFQKPFRFLSSWLGHKYFKKLVKDNWDGDQLIEGGLPRLTAKVDQWHKEEYGNIFAKDELLQDSKSTGETRGKRRNKIEKVRIEIAGGAGVCTRRRGKIMAPEGHY